VLTDPPAARRLDLVEVLHGIEVADPYRWLEDGEDTETIAWVSAQNERTRAVLDALPDRPAWRDRLAELLAAPLSRSCRVAAESVFTLERAGGAPQFALVVRSALDPTVAPRTLVDPAGLAADATTAIDWYHPSRDGRLVAYGVSEGGDERSTLRVLDVTTGDHLDDAIPHTRAASVGWWPDGRGFLYTRYPEDSEYGRTVYEHRLGEPWQDDRLVWGELPQPEAWPDVEVSADGRWALVHVSVGWSRTDVHLYDRENDRWNVVVAGVEARTGFTVDGERLLGTTTLDAPRGRVVVASLDEPATWTTLVDERTQVIDAVLPAGDVFYVLATQRSVARVEVHERDEAVGSEVALPDVGTFAGFDADPATGVAFFQIESFTRPPALHRVTADGSPQPWDAAGRDGDLTRFSVGQQTYLSADGTEVGLFVVHRADQAPSSATPAILTGYGGFAISSTPLWSPLAAAWCERGGLYAVAGLRGGSEEGEAWHADGMRDRKQNVFDDFAAAADFLVGQGFTSREGLALRGGSNGGLLVAAALTQRPALARAVHGAVPLADMVRFSRFLIARLWIPEYGDPDVAAELAWLHAYSPYHHVTEGESYPAVLITTAEGDSRVDPSHARKLAAQLQWASAGQDERPILFHEEGRAGHGVGKPLHKQADEAADVLAFLADQVGLGGRVRSGGDDPR
jgi:prolyl oligopeptidase